MPTQNNEDMVNFLWAWMEWKKGKVSPTTQETFDEMIGAVTIRMMEEHK